MSRKVAILGLGERGRAWAETFRGAGWRVSGFDPATDAPGLPKGSKGWRRETTISATVGSADWVICCLPERIELFRKVIQRAQAAAPEAAVIAVSSRCHDVDAVQGCAIRPAQVILLAGETTQGIEMVLTARNTGELRIDALATLSQVCPDQRAASGIEADAGQRSRDARTA